MSGIGLLALFVRAGLAGSNGEARRHVQGGAIKINDVSISDDKTLVNAGYLNDDGVIKLSLGKKKHVLVRPQ
jgi:tyrosyl-tRNA synthetase